MKTLILRYCYILLLSMLILQSSGHAQHVTIHTGSALRVQPGTVVALPGNLHTQGALVTDESSTISFVGSGIQSLSGAATISILDRRNEGTLILMNPLTIHDVLALRGGFIVIGEHSLTLSAGAILDGSPGSSSFVVTDGTGELRRSIAALDEYSFPIGGGGAGSAVYAPVTIDLNSGSLIDAVIGVRTVSSKPPENMAVDDYLNRHWLISQSGTSSLAAQVTVQYDASEVFGSASEMYFGRWNGTFWELGNPANTAAVLLSGVVSEFGTFTGLPAPMLDFPATLSFGQVELGDWVDLPITLENSGGIDLAVTTAGLSGLSTSEFSIISGGAPFVLSAGSSHDIVLRFTPASATTIPKSAVLTIGGNAPGSPHVVTLAGIGIPCLSHPYTLLVSDDINIEGHDESWGALHANDCITLFQGAPSTHTGAITAVGKIRINKDNTINGDVQAATFQIASGATITGTLTQSAAPSVSLPSVSVTAGSSDITIADNGSATLTPGSYRDIEVGKYATLSISTGIYEARKLILKKGATLVVDMTDGPISMGVTTQLSFGEESEVTLTPWGDAASRWICFSSMQSSPLVLDVGSRVLGSIEAPGAEVVVASGAGLKGSIAAMDVNVQSAVSFMHHTTSVSLPKPGMNSSDISVADYMLDANYPNPFGSGSASGSNTTWIAFSLARESDAVLSVTDAHGKEVTRLLDGQRLASGIHVLPFDAGSLPSGVYFYRMLVQGQSHTRKMVLMR